MPGLVELPTLERTLVPTFVGAFALLITVSTAAATDLLPAPGANAGSSGPSSHQLLSPTPISSDPKWAITLLVGASAGDDKLVQLLTSPWTAKVRDDYFVGGSLSRRLTRFWTYFSLEAEMGVGGRFGATDAAEGWAAIYIRYNGFPWAHILYTTVAVSTGINYISKLPPAETRPGDSTSHLLHYFSPKSPLHYPNTNGTRCWSAIIIALGYLARSTTCGAAPM